MISTELWEHLTKEPQGIVVEFGAMDMLIRTADNLAVTPFDRFLSNSEQALRNAGRIRVTHMIEQLNEYRKLIGQTIITLKDGRKFRYVRK